MTYQKLTHNDDKADEASSLLTVVTASPAPSSSSRQDRVATTKKKNDVPIRAMIVTCFLLGTLAVIFYGGSSNTNSNTNRAVGTSEALLLRHNQAAPVYDPDNGDYCFKAQYGFGIYCWYPTKDHIYSFENWKAVTDRGYDLCGPVCPTPSPTPPPTPPPTTLYADGYDPNHDYCYINSRHLNSYNAWVPTQYCWYATEYSLLYGNWDLHFIPGAQTIYNCGPECPAPPPPPPLPLYDPKQDFCFKDNDNDDKLCWCPTDNFPVGNWDGVGGHGYNGCGPKCTSGCIYDPSHDFCFADEDNVDKYCWYIYQEDAAGHQIVPYGNWKGEGGHGYNDCGRKCTDVRFPTRGGDV